MSRYYGNLESNIDYYLTSFDARCNAAFDVMFSNPLKGILALVINALAAFFLVHSAVLYYTDPCGLLQNDPFWFGRYLVMVSSAVTAWGNVLAWIVTIRVLYEVLRRTYYHIIDVPREMLGPVHRRPNRSYFPLPCGIAITTNFIVSALVPLSIPPIEFLTFASALLISTSFIFQAALLGLVPAAMSSYHVIACLAMDIVNTGIYLCGEAIDIITGNRNYS